MTFPLIFPDDSPRVRESDPITSHEAADATVSKVAASQAIVLQILRNHPRPMTDEEIRHEAHWYGFWSPSRLRSARSELVHQGVVEAVGTVTPEGHRTRATLWAPVTS